MQILLTEIEMLSPVLLFNVYFIFGMILPVILKIIFKKSEFYYTVILSTIILFSCLSGEFVTMTFHDPLELVKIFLKISGMGFGMVITKLFWNRKSSSKKKGGLLNA